MPAVTAPGRRAPWTRDPAAAAGQRPARRRWPWQLVAGVAVLVAFAGLAIAAPLFGTPVHQDLVHGLSPTGVPVGPSSKYPLGTDLLGRSELVRLVYGIRVSLLVAVVSNATSIVIGSAVGLLAGYFRGPVEQLLMRFTDVGLALPYTLAGLVIAAVMSAGLTRVIVIITVLFWSYPARLVYGEVLRLRKRGFVEAGEAMGASGLTIVRRHLAPHVTSMMIAYSPLNAASAVAFEATLSYLSAGINPPTASLGNMISDGQVAISYAPLLVIAPGLAIMGLTLAFLLVGEGVKAFNPDLRRLSWLGR
ncbi:MAG TPA: ABC transporter permease [Streptosporangiaceae bacterium]|nr:ABC transporter permease [Streptosporangiaceae bacterium]